MFQGLLKSIPNLLLLKNLGIIIVHHISVVMGELMDEEQLLIDY